MKSQKGITLISLTIYVIVMAIVVGVVAIISTFFYSNINDTTQQLDPLTEYTDFNSFFSDEVNPNKYRFTISPRENIKKIKEKSLEFVQNFDNPDYKNLLFSGNTGLRKNLSFQLYCK